MFSDAGNQAVWRALEPRLERILAYRAEGFVPTETVLSRMVHNVQDEVAGGFPEVNDTAVREAIWAALEQVEVAS